MVLWHFPRALSPSLGCWATASRSEGISICGEVIQRRLQGSPSKELGAKGDGIGDEGLSESQASGAADSNLETSAASRSKQARNNLKK